MAAPGKRNGRRRAVSKPRTTPRAALEAELARAVEQQTATSEVLRVITSSPTDLQPVLDTVAQNAARLCEATDAVIMRVDGASLRQVAAYGPLGGIFSAPPRRLSRGWVMGRALVDRRTIHVPDLAAEPEEEYPESGAKRAGIRTYLATPLLREGVPVGVIAVRRAEFRPFTDKQIALLETFASQAAIAIENVRLFQELQTRNRELTEALEQQTATSEILRVISSSPTDLQPVMAAVAQNAARLCHASDAQILRIDGDILRPVASYGEFWPAVPVPLNRESVPGRAVTDRQAIHVRDLTAELDEFPEGSAFARRFGHRTTLATPLLREGVPVGAILIRRMEVRPFTDKQIALLKTLADQAVIAIENVRLFQELQARNRELSEALDQQTATSDILRVISSSPTRVEPVFDAILDNAMRLCASPVGLLFLFDGETFRLVADRGAPATFVEPRRTGHRSGPHTGIMRAVTERRAVHILDMLDDPAYAERDPVRVQTIELLRARTGIWVPLLKEGAPIGVIAMWRQEVRAFTDSQIDLLSTFADQAVIAIENVRLFQELQARNHELTESLEQQTATSEILRVISSSPTDLQPVLDAVAENAARLCDASDATIFRLERDVLWMVASHGSLPRPPAMVRREEGVPVNRGSVTGRAVVDRGPVHVHDLAAVSEAEFPEGRAYQRQMGHRTTLGVPLLREGTPLGAILIRRMEVRPFGDKQIKLLETFADQAAIAIENVRLFEELQARTRELARSVEELRALGEVSQAVSSSLDLERVLATIVARADQLSGTDGGAIYEYDETREAFHLRVSLKLEEELIGVLRGTPTPLGQGVVGRAGLAREPVQIPDILEDQAYGGRLREVAERAGYRALLAVPLLREERLIGALVVRRRVPGAFPPETVGLLQTFAAQSGLAIENARLFREIEAKSRQLEIANRHKSEFLANMSHELRTPLNAIIGFSEVLLERMFGEVTPKQAEYLDDILSSGRHLLSLINDILDLSKVEAGRMELELGTFDLALALENALTLVRERATRHGVALERHLDRRLGDFVGDERKVKQIVLNLLSNAVKFTPEGGRIALVARLTDGAVEVSVSDTGIGIAPQDQAAIFEEFRQVGRDYARKREGTGLGLTLTRKFVELHGGKIWVTSEVERGSTFTFTLPVRPWPAS